MPMVSRLAQLTVIRCAGHRFLPSVGAKFRDNLKRVKEALKGIAVLIKNRCLYTATTQKVDNK